MKIERETIKYEIASFHDINEILYRQKKKTIFHIMRYIQSRVNDIYISTNEKKERETIQSEIGNFPILMKYYVAKRRRRYIISWDTSKIEKKMYIYLYINEDWERHNQIWDWQFHDINEILYRQKKKTIFHIMRYIKNRGNDIYTNEKRERETIKTEIGNFMVSMEYYVAKK